MSERISIEKVSVGSRLRPTDAAQVASLAESVGNIGLLNPITVYRREIMRSITGFEDGWGLIAGAHRLEAARKLGWTEFEANVVDLSDPHRQLAEMDENLCGPTLTPAERARFIQRRKDIYIALHPETRNGHNQHTRVRQVGEGSDADHFTADTAARTGRSERSVQRDATRGEKIDGEVLDQIAGTDLHTGATLDRVAKEKTKEDQLRALADERRRKGEALEARKRASVAARAARRGAGDVILSPEPEVSEVVLDAPAAEPEPVLHAAAEPEPEVSYQEMSAPAGADEFAELLAGRLEPEELAQAIVWLATIPGRHLAEALRWVA